MRWFPWLLLVGCGLTLDLEPPIDGGPKDDATAPSDAGHDAGTDAQVIECATDSECFVPDCLLRACLGGSCVEQGAVECEPSDPCHALTGSCGPEGTCDEQFIDDDGDGFAPTELGACGLDCDDGSADLSPERPEICDGSDNDCDGAIDERVAAVCGRDEDGDGFGSAEDITRECGAVSCSDGYVPNLGDCWDGPTEGILPGEASPLLANPAQNVLFGIPRDDDGSYDWDCDGVLTKLYDDRRFVSCDGIDMGGGECRAQSGWEGEPADCGEEALRVACLIGADNRCVASTGLARNACR